MFRRFLPLLALVSLLAAPALAQKHVPSFDEALSLKRVGAPRISPDGRYVAYSLTETNWKDNEYITRLWLADTKSGRSLQLTRGGKSTSNAQWSPDGRWIAFATERAAEPAIEPEKSDKAADAKSDPARKDDSKSDGKPAARQIWVISPEGGEAWQLTKSEGDIQGWGWSKDSTRIAFIANPPKAKPARERKDKYADFEVYEKEYDQNQLFLVDVRDALAHNAPARATQLTHDPDLNIEDFNWSPDSTRIVFSARKVPLLAFTDDSDIYLLDLNAGGTASQPKVSKIVALVGPDQSPVFSPDGKQVAFETALSGKNYYYLNHHIAIVDIDKALAHPADDIEQVSDVSAAFDEDPGIIDWGPEGIYFYALQKTASHLFRIDPRTRAVTRLTQNEGGAHDSASFSRDFKTVAFTMSDAQHALEIYVSPVANFAPRRLTSMSDQLANFTLGTSEVVSWKSSDGTLIEGILHKPADYDPSRRYPLLLVIHGGPTGISRPTLQPADRTYPIQQFLARGALVLEPNYRGSAGYGQRFRSLNVRNLGVGDMMDVMSGVDSLIARGMVDPGKLGAMGWSQGGYISAFLTTHTDRFKAISVGAGISDWVTYYVSTDITPFTRQYLQATPWDDPEIYAKTSPMTTIKQAKTPTLIQQGSNDKRVPVPDSFELYRGLQDQNVPSRLILYTGFGRGITKPRSNRAVLQANYDWFAHYLWDQEIPRNSALLGQSELVVEAGQTAVAAGGGENK